MAGRRRSRWFWALLAAFVLVLSGVAMVWWADTPALRYAGYGIFVVAGLVYVLARFAMIREDRYE